MSNSLVLSFIFILCLTTGHVQANLKTWMSDFVQSDPGAGVMPFNHWMLPGTHDAGCYVPERLYTSTQNVINWDSAETMTEASNSFLFYGAPVQQTAVTHHLNIRGQLEMGARYFDLRFARGKLIGLSDDQLYMDHNGIGFGKLTEVTQNFIDYSNSLGPGRCEIVWLRVKITSDVNPETLMKQGITGFEEMEKNKGKFHQWRHQTAFPNKPTQQEILEAATPKANGQLVKDLTYNSLCANHQGVVYLLIFAKDSKLEPTLKFISHFQGKAVFEENLMVGPAATRRRLHYVLETQQVTVAGYAAEANTWYTNAATRNLPYRFNQFRRVYLTSTGGQGDAVVRLAGKLMNLNIFSNSYGIWKYYLPSAVAHIRNIAVATSFYKIEEQTAVNHFLLTSVTTNAHITSTTFSQVQKARAMDQLTTEDVHQWTKIQGYLDRSHTHILMLDFCELACPTAVEFATHVMRSRLNPLVVPPVAPN